MAKTLEQILGYATMTAMIAAPAGGVPESAVPPGFLTQTVQVEGDVAQWDVIPATRKTAQASIRGSASRRVDASSQSTRTAKMIHSFEHTMHGIDLLSSLRGNGGEERQMRAQQVIDARTMNFGRRFENLRISSVYSALRHGAIYLDGNGNLLPSSSGAVTTVDLGVSANHKDQLNGIIGTSWANAAAPVLGDLTAIATQAIKDSGFPIKYAIYGTGVIDSLIANTAIGSAILSNNPITAQALMQGMIPDGFGIPGCKWLPAYPAFYEDADGTTQDWFPSDFIVFIPEVSAEWYELQEGSFEVPTNITVASDANAALSNFAHTYGRFSYATISTDPVGIKHAAGDTFLPCFKNPDALFIADTQF